LRAQKQAHDRYRQSLDEQLAAAPRTDEELER
jgi:hypothetical protein